MGTFILFSLPQSHVYIPATMACPPRKCFVPLVPEELYSAKGSQRALGSNSLWTERKVITLLSEKHNRENLLTSNIKQTHIFSA